MHQRGEEPQDRHLLSSGPVAASALFKIQHEPLLCQSLPPFNDGDNLEKYHTQEELFNFTAFSFGCGQFIRYSTGFTGFVFSSYLDIFR